MKQYRPTTPSRRHMSTLSFRKALTTDSPEKSLTKGFRRGSGRDNAGRISVRHKGGGHKRSYREVDFIYDKIDIPATIVSVEYDPNRSGYIGLVNYRDGEKRYVILPKAVKVGDTFLVSETAPIQPGNRTPLGKIPVGTFVYNIELKPGSGAALVRSAGNFAEVVAQDAGYTHLKLPSTEVRSVISTAWASIGEVSNDEHRLVNIGKAGRSRWMGIRPTVRGSAMNPVDHPHGGGEGKSPQGNPHPVSPWGTPSKGYKTRQKRKASSRYIVKRRK